MKWPTIISAAILAVCATANAQFTVTVYAPIASSNGGPGNYTSPVLAAAVSTAPNPSGWDVYLDNNSTPVIHNTTQSNRLNATFAASPGTHYVVIKGWDNSGASVMVGENITVNASELPTPPANATYFPHLQQPSGTEGSWNYCTNTACSGSAQGETCSGSVSINSPMTASLSGFPIKETVTGTYCNILGWLPPQCPSGNCSSVSNLLEDMWFETTSTGQMQASEFDPDLYDGTHEYQLSMQCRLVSGGSNPAGVWYLWNMTGTPSDPQGTGGTGAWVATSYPCTASTIAPGYYHHYQIYATVDTATGRQTYQTFVFDGKTVYQNLNRTFDALASSHAANVNIQQQIDNGGQQGATNTNYYDDYNLWVW